VCCFCLFSDISFSFLCVLCVYLLFLSFFFFLVLYWDWVVLGRAGPPFFFLFVRLLDPLATSVRVVYFLFFFPFPFLFPMSIFLPAFPSQRCIPVALRVYFLQFFLSCNFFVSLQFFWSLCDFFVSLRFLFIPPPPQLCNPARWPAAFPAAAEARAVDRATCRSGAAARVPAAVPDADGDVPAGDERGLFVPQRVCAGEARA
jgi:hypothetical protein